MFFESTNIFSSPVKCNKTLSLLSNNVEIIIEPSSLKDINPTPLQLRKIEAIWWDICDSAESVKQIRSLRKFIKRQCKIDDIKFLSKREASKLIAVLEKIKSEKLLKAL